MFVQKSTMKVLITAFLCLLSYTKAKHLLIETENSDGISTELGEELLEETKKEIEVGEDYNKKGNYKEVRPRFELHRLVLYLH